MRKYALSLLVVLAFSTVGWGLIPGQTWMGLNPYPATVVSPLTGAPSVLPLSMRMSMYGGSNVCSTLGMSPAPAICPTPSPSLCPKPNPCLIPGAPICPRPIVGPPIPRPLVLLPGFGQDGASSSSWTSYFSVSSSGDGAPNADVSWSWSNDSQSQQSP